MGLTVGVYVKLATEWLIKEIGNVNLYNQITQSFKGFKVEEDKIILKRSLLAYLIYNN